MAKVNRLHIGTILAIVFWVIFFILGYKLGMEASSAAATTVPLSKSTWQPSLFNLSGTSGDSLLTLSSSEPVYLKVYLPYPFMVDDGYIASDWYTHGYSCLIRIPESSSNFTLGSIGKSMDSGIHIEILGK